MFLKIEVPAYWQQESVGIKISSMARVYCDWLKENIGRQGCDWNTAHCGFDNDNLAFSILSKYNVVDIQKKLEGVAMIHMLKHGPTWEPTTPWVP